MSSFPFFPVSRRFRLFQRILVEQILTDATLLMWSHEKLNNNNQCGQRSVIK
jgi:hypothetical protein